MITYQYQKTGRFFGQIADGLEELGSEELRELGATDVIPGHRGITFNTDMAGLYRINYRSRLLSRVLAPLITFDCHSSKYLYKTARSLPWAELFGLENTFAVFTQVSGSAIKHSQYAGLCLKDAIADTFRDQYDRRPDVDPKTPDVWLNLHIQHNRATISLDTSGGSLHKRGYRKGFVDAPIQETVAAAIIRLSGWNGEKPLYDPMCGSGTLLCEALMHAANIPAGYLRPTFGFRFLPEHDRHLWETIRQEGDDAMNEIPSDLIQGSDIDSKAIRAARQNLAALPRGERVQVSCSDYRDLEDLSGRTIVCNPPYGIRMKQEGDINGFVKGLGDFLKQRCTNSRAFLYFGDRTLIKSIGLRTTWKKPLKNGGLDGRLVRLDLY
ncbi:MAG TPA: THUMP domain-containing protein [Desulfomicrobiaceae bacterium]|nr:THUMP domain-containing protein [Desulfomicrobiaceae bacterium]